MEFSMRHVESLSDRSALCKRFFFLALLDIKYDTECIIEDMMKSQVLS